jgi:hypothetical protein
MPGISILTQSPTLVGNLTHAVTFLLLYFKGRRLVGRHLCVLLVQVNGIVFHIIFSLCLLI